MVRVSMGPKADAGAVIAACLVGANAAIAERAGDRVLAAIGAAGVVITLAVIATSLRQRDALYALGCVLAAVGAAAAFGTGDRLRIVLACLAAAGAVAWYPWFRRRAGSAVRTEELVGRTVGAAERLLGYGSGLPPARMAKPTLVAVPHGAAPSDLDDPAVRAGLVITAVSIDPTVPSITFGVAPPNSVRRRDVSREELQAELVARVGGFPGVLRPGRRPCAPPTLK